MAHAALGLLEQLRVLATGRRRTADGPDGGANGESDQRDEHRGQGDHEPGRGVTTLAGEGEQHHSDAHEPPGGALHRSAARRHRRG